LKLTSKRSRVTGTFQANENKHEKHIFGNFIVPNRKEKHETVTDDSKNVLSPTSDRNSATVFIF